MHTILLISLLVAPHLPIGSTNSIECSRVQRNSSCFIEGLSFQFPSDEYSAVFPTSSHIIIESSEILHFSAHLFDALAETAFLTLKSSLIPTVTFRSDELHSLRIDNTGLREFTVTPHENRNLNTLIISGNPLATIPPTIRHLTGLSILDLSNNQLTHVNLNWFQTMDNLLVLDLSANRISQIDINPALRLARLKNFWVNHNQLQRIEFFPDFTPALRRVRLVENYWSCEWVTQVRQSIWSSTIQVYGAEYICEDKVDGGLCCYEGRPVGVGNREPPVHETVSFGGRRRVEHLPRAERFFARHDNAEEQQNTQLNRSYNVLEQKYRKVVEEKELLERRFVNTVRELERTVKRLTAELTEAQDVIRSQNLKVKL